MVGTVRIVSPVGESVVQEGRPAPRLASLDGHRIALLDNMKSNADVLLDRIGANLRRDGHGVETKRFRKPTTPAQPFAAEVFDEVRHYFAAAIAAVGD